MIRFFQIKAETVGMMKNGEITRTRTMPCPQNGLSSSSASRTPPTMLTPSTSSTSATVLKTSLAKNGSAMKYLKFASPAKNVLSGSLRL